MTPIRAALFLTAAAALSACAVGADVTRSAPVDAGFLTADAPGAPAVAIASSYKVRGVEVVVPETLTVSEANSYFPGSDIVWREDPPGDRRAQVDALITKAITDGVAGLNGSRPVNLQIVVTRFHALTEKTRYNAPQGTATHDVQTMLTIVDAASGDVIEPARPFNLLLEAHTSDLAMSDQAQGITQRSRISSALGQLIQAQLGSPAG